MVSNIETAARVSHPFSLLSITAKYYKVNIRVGSRTYLGGLKDLKYKYTRYLSIGFYEEGNKYQIELKTLFRRYHNLFVETL